MTAAVVGDKRTPLFAGVKVWFSPNLLIADLSLRDELVRRGATVVEQAGTDSTSHHHNNNNKQMILHIVASASDSVCAQASMRHNKLATVHYIRALIEHDSSASNSPLALPIEWNGNLLASLAMRGIVVCCTGMAPAEKTRLHGIVFALGGTVARTLDDSVTHLVATRTDTVKYIELAGQLVAAAKAKRRSPYERVVVCEPAWLDKCDREQPLTREQVPTSALFRLLPLSGQICALSGFRNNMRNVVQHTIEMLGGKFTAALSLVTSHLICASEDSDKYRHCVKQQIDGRKVVSLEWLALCVELGMRVSEAEFAFVPGAATDAEHERLTQQLELALMADTDGVRARRHGLFVGKYFAAHGLADAARTRLRRQLAKLGGTLLKPDARAFEVAHYIVCGHGVDRPRVPANAPAPLVSETWIAGCLNSETLLPIRDCIAFTPMTCRVPLAGASAVRAHITGRDKLSLSLLAGTLGMQLSDNFDRSTTHLVVHRDDFNRAKLVAAHRRQIVCVYAEWLSACAAAGQIVAVNGFDVNPASIVGAEIAAAAAAAAAAASSTRSATRSEVPRDTAASSDDGDDEDGMQHVLRGVSLYVGRDVADRELLHALADELGAKTALQPDAAVTHFVYAGAPQKSGEYHALVRKRAHDAPLLCVAPLWLTMCRDARRRVDESLATSAHDPLRTSLLAPADTAAERSPVAGAKKRGSSRGTSATAVLRTKRLDIPRELPRTVRRTTTATSTLALAAGPPPQLNLHDDNNDNDDDDDGFGGNATPMIIATTMPSTVDRDARLAQRIEGLLHADDAEQHEFAFDSYGDSMAFDASVHQSLSQSAALPVSAVCAPTRRDGAHDFNDADTTSVAVAAVGGGGSIIGGGGGGGVGGGQPTPQAVRYGLSADEKKRRDEVLARAKRRKMTVDDSKGVAVTHSAGKQNSVENLSEQLGVHVVVSNFAKSDATDILDRLRRLSVVVDRDVIARLTTHVVVYQPSRSVKFLCALAAGVWIVSPSWVDASERAGFLIDPSAYEWSVATASDSPLAEMAKKDPRLFRAPALNRRACISTGLGVFAEWTVCVLADERRRNVLESILVCGSAKVSEALGSGLTHVLLEQSATELSDPAALRQLRSLSRSGVHVVSANFLQEYLTTFPRPSSNDAQYQVAALQQTATRSSSMSKSHTSTVGVQVN